ncbi:MAG: acyl-CoA dehydrogenase family protein, partial [Marinibacterium sp.]|nr:acyl-CoA dehydrogenase family protein [Marinibacterium sp.]
MSTPSRFLPIARDLSKRFAPRAARWDQERDYCWDNVHDLAEAGLMGMTLPETYGGQGASWLDVVQVVE